MIPQLAIGDYLVDDLLFGFQAVVNANPTESVNFTALALYFLSVTNTTLSIYKSLMAPLTAENL